MKHLICTHNYLSYYKALKSNAMQSDVCPETTCYIFKTPLEHGNKNDNMRMLNTLQSN